MEPIRVLQVVHGMGCGGAENMIMNLYRKLDRSKVQFDFLVHTDKKCFFDDEIESLGGHIYRVSYFNLVNYFAYKKALNEFFSAHPEIKIVHGHLGSCAHIYLAVAKKYGCYTIAHCHNSKPPFSIKSTLYYIFNLKTRKVADYFMACSLMAGEYRYGQKIAHSDKFSVLNNAIDSDRYIFSADKRRKSREEFNLTDEILIGHIGRFNEQKNHLFLLNVFSEINKINPKAKLMLVGGGELEIEIREKAEVLGILDGVIFTGVRSDVPELLCAMDLFIFPSVYEGLGIVAVEAQASGLKVLCSDVLPEESAVTENITYYSLNDSPSAWAEKAMSMLPYERKDTSREIKEHHYDINETVKWLEEFYVGHIK